MKIQETEKKFGQKLLVVQEESELAYISGSFPSYQLACKKVGYARVNRNKFHVGVIYDETDSLEIGDVELLAKESGLKIILNEKWKS